MNLLHVVVARPEAEIGLASLELLVDGCGCAALTFTRGSMLLSYPDPSVSRRASLRSLVPSAWMRGRQP
jgi:hypothetical protein